MNEDSFQTYQRDGFFKVANLLSREEASHYYSRAHKILDDMKKSGDERLQRDRLQQCVNIWLEDEVMRELTLHDKVAAWAEHLSGHECRLWHDHILAKPPHNNMATEFHQDKPYWPHLREEGNPISAWIALDDVPAEKGCMSFIPGSHRLRDLPPQSLDTEGHLFSFAEELRWKPRVTFPMRAGDVTFHHGLTAHMANPNTTGDYRIAHTVIYMDHNTRYRDRNHVVTNPIKQEFTGGLKAGDVLDHPHFPKVSAFPEVRARLNEEALLAY